VIQKTVPNLFPQQLCQLYINKFCYFRIDSCTILLKNYIFATQLTETVSVNYVIILPQGWLGSRVVSVLDSGTKGPEFKLQF